MGCYALQPYNRTIRHRTLEAAWLSQKVCEIAGFPRQFLNFDKDGEYCYSREAQLALFTPFTSDVPGMSQCPKSGRFTGRVSKNGRQYRTRGGGGVDEEEVAPAPAALRATMKWAPGAMKWARGPSVPCAP